MESEKSKHRPNIVVLDGFTLNPGDLSWDVLQGLGNVTIYEHSSKTEALARAKEAQIILTNKTVIDEAMLAQLPKLKCICLLSTGFNVIDIEAAKKRQLPVCNAVGYGSNSVAQHVFALLLELTNQVGAHHQSVQNGDWSKHRDFSYSIRPIMGLVNKTLGIYGFGKIGQKVGSIAQAFGMRIIAHHKHPKRDARPGVAFVSLDTLFRESDVLTLHAPLNAQNKGIINTANLAKMKPSAFLINTGRGGLIQEADLKNALEKELIAGAALDVLSVEPPPIDHILFGVKNCLLTPHNAWASREARQKLLDIVIENIKAFLDGRIQNNVY